VRSGLGGLLAGVRGSVGSCSRAAGTAPGGRKGCAGARQLRPALSGGGERADAVQRGDVVAVPGPADREVKRLAACVAGQAAGDGEQSAAQRSRGADGAVGEAE